MSSPPTTSQARSFASPDSWVGAAARATLLAATGAALGVTINAVRSDRVSPDRFAAPASCSASAPASVPLERLPPPAAAALCGDETVVVADARPPARFAEGHVSGAVHLPCAAPGSLASDGLAALVGKGTVVVYGDTTDEALAVAESLRLRADMAGRRVAVLEGGFPAWSQAGLACSSGPCASCTAPAKSSHIHQGAAP